MAASISSFVVMIPPNAAHRARPSQTSYPTPARRVSRADLLETRPQRVCEEREPATADHRQRGRDADLLDLHQDACDFAPAPDARRELVRRELRLVLVEAHHFFSFRIARAISRTSFIAWKRSVVTTRPEHKLSRMRMNCSTRSSVVEGCSRDISSPPGPGGSARARGRSPPRRRAGWPS